MALDEPCLSTGKPHEPHELSNVRRFALAHHGAKPCPWTTTHGQESKVTYDAVKTCKVGKDAAGTATAAGWAHGLANLVEMLLNFSIGGSRSRSGARGECHAVSTRIVLYRPLGIRINKFPRDAGSCCCQGPQTRNNARFASQPMLFVSREQSLPGGDSQVFCLFVVMPGNRFLPISSG